MAGPDFRGAPPSIVSCGPDHALGQWGDHLIGVWDGAPSVAAVRAWGQLLGPLVRSRPGKTVYLSYERAGFQMPEEAARTIIVDTLRSLDGALAACTVVVPATGFSAAAVRALSSSLSLIARTTTPIRTAGSIDEAHAWVARVAPQVRWPTSAQELREAIALVEASIGRSR